MGRTWLRELSTLCQWYGFKEAMTRRGPSELAICLRTPKGVELWLRTVSHGTQWMAHVTGTRFQTGGTLKITLGSLEKAHRLVFFRIVKPILDRQ